MSQLYEVDVRIPLSDVEENATVLVCASNADQAIASACVHLQIAPSMCVAEARRVKGNAYTINERVREMRVEARPVPRDAEVIAAADAVDAGRLADACKIQSSEQYRPRLSRRVLELRATIYARTDAAAMSGIGRALMERGRVGSWRSKYVELEDLKVIDDDERRPNNPRAITNAQYVGARVFRT